jgi:hypothetical protein
MTGTGSTGFGCVVCRIIALLVFVLIVDFLITESDTPVCVLVILVVVSPPSIPLNYPPILSNIPPIISQAARNGATIKSTIPPTQSINPTITVFIPSQINVKKVKTYPQAAVNTDRAILHNPLSHVIKDAVTDCTLFHKDTKNPLMVSQFFIINSGIDMKGKKTATRPTTQLGNPRIVCFIQPHAAEKAPVIFCHNLMKKPETASQFFTTSIAPAIRAATPATIKAIGQFTASHAADAAHPDIYKHRLQAMLR